MKRFLYTLIILIIYIQTNAQIFVDVNNASGTENGNTWSTAFTSIQDGIDAAYSSGQDVWVASGTYYIYESSNENTILLKEGVNVYGGFSGLEDNLAERDWEHNETIISGYEFNGSSNQVQHVVSALKTTMGYFWTEGSLDGFTVTGGNSSLP
ncbi:MAG: hypothetical protein C0594_11785, partial [Marinilabiliales bacterium]